MYPFQTLKDIQAMTHDVDVIKKNNNKKKIKRKKQHVEE